MTLSTQTAVIDLSSGPCENHWPVPPVRRCWFVACNYNGYNSCAPGKLILSRLSACVRPITFGVLFLFIYLYSFRILAQRSRRYPLLLTTTSAFFKFRNDNGLKLARFDYRYRMPEWISRTVLACIHISVRPQRKLHK